MRRIDLPELEDQAWCPALLRDAATDHLRLLAEVTRGFDGALPLLHRALARSSRAQIVDLCSGAGGPWVSLARALPGVPILLTDRYPNYEAFTAIAGRTGAQVRGHPAAIDADDCPLPGVRTLFNGFHHLPWATARRVLADAVARNEPILVVEASDHRGIGAAIVALVAASSVVAAPWAPRDRWRRLALSWVVPAIPALLLYDGLASILRLYGAEELRELTAEADPEGRFAWEIGRAPVRGAPIGGLGYLLGLPPGPR